jgi:hypothetical protein
MRSFVRANSAAFPRRPISWFWERVELGHDRVPRLVAGRHEGLRGLDRHAERGDPPQEPTHEVHPLALPAEQPLVTAPANRVLDQARDVMLRWIRHSATDH